MLAPRARCIPSPACGGGVGRGHGIKIEGAFNTIHVHALTPPPTLPRKRGREQTESAARADSTSNERALALVRSHARHSVRPLRLPRPARHSPCDGDASRAVHRGAIAAIAWNHSWRPYQEPVP